MGHRRSAPELVAAATSLMMITAGVWWWALPEAYPLTEPDPLSLISGPWPAAGSLLLLTLGVIGLLGAVLAMVVGRGGSGRWTDSRWAWPALVVAVLLVAVAFGVGADAKVLVAAGYLLALAGPPGLLVVLAVSARSHRPVRYVLGALLVVGGAYASVTGMASVDVVVELGRNLASGLADAGAGIAFSCIVFGIGCVWIGVLVRLLPLVGRRSSRGSASCGGAFGAHGGPRGSTAGVPRWITPEGAARWGRWVTIAAVIGQLPYPLIRMTWLTPWPLFGDEMVDLMAEPETRMFGLSLGFAAIGGAVLTIGLIRPWGEVFPRWIPLLGGRPVPPRPPAIAGLLVGGVVTIAGRSLLFAPDTGPSGLAAWQGHLLMPLWLWGPMLIAASVAYALRRRALDRRPPLGRDSDGSGRVRTGIVTA